MNLADPELELIDPTPNVHSLFLSFDQMFFWSKLSCQCIVRWSKRMYSSAGVTSYEGRGSLCQIALSEPLLKLRPRKDFVQTLLHEMIHAYLFVTNNDRDRDGHGPIFKAHMHRINRATGLNISIYHDYHDEVELYQTHWWRCNGPCQLQKPYFGIVRRHNNRAPGPSEHWWKYHRKHCGGTFFKIKEPEKPEKKSKKNNISKPNADIIKYINNNNVKEATNKNITKVYKPNIPVLKGSTNIPVKPKKDTKIKSNKNTVIVSVKKPKTIILNPSNLTTGKEETSNDMRVTDSVIATVRSVWANKQIDKLKTKELSKYTLNDSTPAKHEADNHIKSPPYKMKKIDDYFKTEATSVLKNIYGHDFNLTQSKSEEKLKAVPKINNFVDCPVCYSKIDSCMINKHLDECLNKDLIEKLAKERASVTNESKVDRDEDDKVKSERIVTIEVDESKFKKELVQSSRSKEDYKATKVVEEHLNKNNPIEVTTKGFDNNANRKRRRTLFDINDFRTTEQIKIDKDKKITNLRKSFSVVGPTANTIQETTPITLNSPIKAEPGTSKSDSTSDIACLCCGEKLIKSADEHLDECLSFFENNTTIPVEGASTSDIGETIIIDEDDDDDDKFDESQTFNATGTKYPCPCCLKMVEETNMNGHLDECLS